MSLDSAQVTKIAMLARLSLTPYEIETATEQLGKIVDMFRELEQVNTDGIQPLVHAIELQNVTAADQVKPSIARQAALGNAPAADEECFRVTAVL